MEFIRRIRDHVTAHIVITIGVGFVVVAAVVIPMVIAVTDLFSGAGTGSNTPLIRPEQQINSAPTVVESSSVNTTGVDTTPVVTETTRIPDEVIERLGLVPNPELTYYNEAGEVIYQPAQADAVVPTVPEAVEWPMAEMEWKVVDTVPFPGIPTEPI